MIVNVLAFQAGWFACVLGAARGMEWLGPLAVVTVVTWHVIRASSRERELGLLAVAGLTGLAFETALAAAGAVVHQPSTFTIGGVPLWMIALWPLFATTLNVSLRWLRDRPVLAAACGLIGGALSYWGGARLGAIDIPNLSGLAAIAIGWAVAMPVLGAIARRLDGFTTDRIATTGAIDGHA